MFAFGVTKQRGGPCAVRCKPPDLVWNQRWWRLGPLSCCSTGSGGRSRNKCNSRYEAIRSRSPLSSRRARELRIATCSLTAETFLKKSGGNSKSYILCHKSSKILSHTSEELGETPRGSNAWVWNRKNCASFNVSLTGWE